MTLEGSAHDYAKRAMTIANMLQASDAVSTLLRGAQLDTIRIFSLVLNLGFVHGNRIGLPNVIWVSLSGALSIDQKSNPKSTPSGRDDFFEVRGNAIRQLYSLIGGAVSGATVAASGRLEIVLGEHLLQVGPSESDSDLEEVWAVMSDSPDVSVDHSWYVMLDDSGRLSTRTPSTFIAR